MTFEELKKDPNLRNIDKFIKDEKIFDNAMNLAYALFDDYDKILNIIERCMNGEKLIYLQPGEEVNEDYEFVGAIIEAAIYIHNSDLSM